MRMIVVPGEKLGEAKPGKLPQWVFRDGDSLYSAVYGLFDPEKGIRVTPIHGKYIPRPGDIVIGIVLSMRHSGYLVDINSAYIGFLHVPREGIRLEPGDVITAKVSSRDEVGNTHLESPRRLIKGKLIEISSTKVPRIFGKAGSMLDLIRKGTGIQIIVGRNGRIWLRGDREKILKAEKVIRFIEDNAHLYGVTDKVKEMLETDDKDNEQVNEGR